MQTPKRPPPLALIVALGAYGILGSLCVREVGLVGEVAIGWTTGRPPAALVQLEPPLWADGLQAPSAGQVDGPLVSSLVRPVERLHLGPVDLPLAINRYTGGPPDWPALLLYRITGSTRAVIALNLLLGGLLLVLTHRFLRVLRGRRRRAAVLVLATDWSFVFYRKVLGGTELALLFGLMACLWGLWTRRWTGGRYGLAALGLGLGLGLLGKLTFVLSFGALLATALLMRWDRQAMRPPLPRRPALALLGTLLLVSPLLLTALHFAVHPPALALPSHDFVGTQWQRVLGALRMQAGPAREGLGNLGLWAVQPLAFFQRAYGAAAPGPSGLRAAGLAVVGLGLAMAWLRRQPAPREALTRFVSVLLPLMLLVIGGVARDLHHLGLASLVLAMAAGLGADQLAAQRAPPHSLRRRPLAAVLVLPLVLTGARDLLRTDAVVRSITVPTFTEAGQAALAAMIIDNGVERLVVADYESYGMLELRVPQVAVEHAWPAVALTRRAALPALLRRAEGAHLLVVQASAPMVYVTCAPAPKRSRRARQHRGWWPKRCSAWARTGRCSTASAGPERAVEPVQQCANSAPLNQPNSGGGPASHRAQGALPHGVLFARPPGGRHRAGRRPTNRDFRFAELPTGQGLAQDGVHAGGLLHQGLQGRAFDPAAHRAVVVEGIDHLAALLHLVVQVRGGGPAGVAAQGDDIACVDRGALLHPVLREVQELGQTAIGVLDLDAVAIGGPVPVHPGDLAGPGRQDGGAHGGLEVHAGVAGAVLEQAGDLLIVLEWRLFQAEGHLGAVLLPIGGEGVAGGLPAVGGHGAAQLARVQTGGDDLDVAPAVLAPGHVHLVTALQVAAQVQIPDEEAGIDGREGVAVISGRILEGAGQRVRDLGAGDLPAGRDGGRGGARRRPGRQQRPHRRAAQRRRHRPR